MDTLNHKFYYNAYLKHGISAKGVHWQSEYNQYLRFKIITVYLENIENSTLIDLGCGFAEYLNFLEKYDLKLKKYIGVDCESFMIENSKKRFPKDIFLKANILNDKFDDVDYVICSGGLNIMNQEDFLEAIEKSFKIAKKAFIFNFLTKNSLHLMKKRDVIRFVHTLTNKVEISSNYLKNDATICLKK
ncbi:class I SAM-dependent methyltransferase [Campylobacterota bacterium DY0563]